MGAVAALKALDDEPAEASPEDREAAPGMPVVLKRGAVAMKTKSSGG